MRRLRDTLVGGCVAIVCMAGVAIGSPITPKLIGHDINFGAFNSDGTAEWSFNGDDPDTLTYVASEDDREATAYWPAWPGPPVFPIFYDDMFAGDVVLDVKFTGQDAPYVGSDATLDVSLVGTGNRAGADLEIWGSIGAPGAPMLLWAVDLEEVSLYGYSGNESYKLDGIGVIVGGMIAEQNGLIGQPGAMRGDLDFFDGIPGIPPLLPSLYDPSEPLQGQVRAAYSGETGQAVPEPTSLVLIGLGLMLLRRR